MPRDDNGDPFVVCDGEECESRIFTTVKSLNRYNGRPESEWRCRTCARGDGE